MCVSIYLHILRGNIYIYLYSYPYIFTHKLVTSNPLEQKSELYCIIDGVNPIRHICLCISGLLSQ